MTRSAIIKIGDTLAYPILIGVTVHGAEDILALEQSAVFVCWVR